MTSSNHSNRINIYLVLIVGFSVMFFSSSVKNVFQVYFINICTFFDLTRVEFSWSGSAFMIVTGVGAWIAGIMCDKFGAKNTIVLGTLMVGLSFVVSSLWDNFSVFLVMYGVVAALALAAIQFVPMGVLVDEVFSEKNKGIAYAILTNGTGLGFVVLSPLWVYLNISMNWQTIYMGIGLLFLIFLVPLVAFCLKHQHQPPQQEEDRIEGAWLEAIKHPAFWFLAVSFLGCGINMAFIDIHFVPLMQDADTTPAVVGTTLSLLGILEIAGGFVAGWLSGRASPALLLCGFYLLRAVSGVILSQAISDTNIFIFSALFGASYLGTVIVTSLFCLRIFGSQSKGTVFGLLFFIHQIGAFFSTWQGANLRDITGNYDLTLVIATCFSVLSAFMALGLFKSQKEPPVEKNWT